MNFLNLRTALGNFRNNKLLSLLNIAGLGTGLAVAILIFNYTYQEFQADKYHENLEDIYVVKNKERAHVYYEMAPLIDGQFTGIRYVSMVESGMTSYFVLRFGDNESIKSEVIFADGNFTSIFEFEVVSGNLENVLSQPRSIILTESESKRLFADENPIGKILMLKSNTEYINECPVEVKAVIKDLAKNSNIQFNAVASFATARETMFWIDQCIWSCSNVLNYVLLEKGKDPRVLAKQMNEQLRPLVPEDTECEISLLPYEDVYFSSIRDDFKHGNLKLIYTLGAIALLILLIATINYINLSMAGSSKRLNEVGVKKIAGVEHWQLIRQFLGESILISLFAMFLGLLLAWILTPPINNLSVITLPAIPFTSIKLWLVLSIAAICIGFVAGLIPAIALSKYKPIALLTGKSKSHYKGINLKRGLIVFQFVTSIALIICTLTITRQLSYVKSLNMGFDTENVINIKLSPEIEYQTLKDKLERISGVKAVSYSRWYPGNIGENWGRPLVYNGTETEVWFACENADASYIDLMGLEIVQGRKFSDLKSDVGCAIINEAAVKKFGLENPMEAFFQKREETNKVIGVVKDFNFQSLHNEIKPLVIFCTDQQHFSVNVKLAAGDFNTITSTLDQINSTWDELSPGFPIESIFIDEHIESLYQTEMVFEKIFRYGSVFAIFISCLGLFGLVISSTEQRKKEIGIRRVNGARILEILLMLNKDFIKWVLLAFVIASPAAWFFMRKWLENFAYRTTLSWWIFALAGVLALGISLLTVSWQSWKTATRNPIEALRYE
jgi:putative ABC transport system permease protein